MKDVEAIETLFKQHPAYRRAAIDLTRGRWKKANPAARKDLFDLAMAYQAESDGDLVKTALNVLFAHKPEKHDLYALCSGRGDDVHTPWVRVRSWMRESWPGQRRLKAETIGDLLYMSVERAMAQGVADNRLLCELLDDVTKEPPARRERLLNKAMAAWVTLGTSVQRKSGIEETLGLLVGVGGRREPGATGRGDTTDLGLWSSGKWGRYGGAGAYVEQ